MSVPLPGPFVRRRPGFAATLLAVVGDAAAWRSGGYFLIKIVLAPITFGLAIGLYSFGLGAITYPFWRVYLPAQQASDGSFHRGAQWWPDYFVDTVPRMAFAAVLGVLVLWLAPRVVRVPLTLDRMLIAGLLGSQRPGTAVPSRGRPPAVLEPAVAQPRCWDRRRPAAVLEPVVAQPRCWEPRSLSRDGEQPVVAAQPRLPARSASPRT